MQVAGDHLLADAAFACDQDRGLRRRDLFGHGHDGLHGRVLGNHRPVIIGHGRQNGSDQFGFWRQGDEFLGPGADSVGRTARVSSDTAGNYGHMNMLGLIGRDQGGNIEIIIDHHQVCALASAQGIGRLMTGFHMRNPCTCRHGHFDRSR